MTDELGQQRQLRKQLWGKRDQTEQAGDIQGAFNAAPRIVTKTFIAAYTEPMVIGGITEQPENIILTRVVTTYRSEIPVLCGSMCHFAWKPELGGAQITSIDGLTPAPGVTYEFTFWLTFPAASRRT
jgi:hypothetical protein